MLNAVRIVMDAEFGSRLGEFEPESLWVVDSATNLEALQLIRRARPEFRPTTFRAAAHETASEQVVELLPTVELHHGPLSQQPPADRVEVYGAPFDETIEAVLHSLGFTLNVQTPEGFAAIRAPAV